MLKDAWMLAIESLSWIELQRLGERLAIAKASKQLEIEDLKIIGLAHKLVFETLRRLNAIDAVLNDVLAPRSLSEFRLGSKAFLRLYAYRVLFESASYEEAVMMARTGRSILGWQQLKDIEETLGRVIDFPLKAKAHSLNDEERTALQMYSPTWLVKYCFKMMGRHEALNFLSSISESLPTYLRLNTLRLNEESFLKKLREEDVIVEKEHDLKHTYRVSESRKPLTRTRSFREGLFYIQDKASCLAVEVAGPEPGDTVLDICAAPGAKTTYMAQLMQNRGLIFSLDFSKRRMAIWKREMKRMGVKNATPLVVDAQKLLPLQCSADVVILDPPCTSIGAFSKTPSAKWRLTKRSISNMAEIQWNMLNSCAEKVREGGHLVYSTCSVSLEENEILIERFLKWNLSFKLVETLPRIGLPGMRGLSQCQRLYPHIHKCNGFFVAKLERHRS